MRPRDVAGPECLEGGPKETLNEAVKVKSVFQWRAQDIAKNRTSVEKSCRHRVDHGIPCVLWPEFRQCRQEPWTLSTNLQDSVFALADFDLALI